MGLRVTLVSGPRKSGKSAVIRALIDRVCKQRPHFVRMVRIGPKTRIPRLCSTSQSHPGVASLRRLEYDDQRIFTVLPETLTTIHKQDRYGLVLIEANADPILRNAYSFDHRIFVLPLPQSVYQVFRTPKESAAALKDVLKDTTIFASEIFGMWGNSSPLDSDLVEGDITEDRTDLSAAQWRGFLHTPLGEELATRIQLQPAYHGLLESDVVIVNTGVGEKGLHTEPCLQKLNTLLGKMRKLTERKSLLFTCDLYGGHDLTSDRLLEALQPMCHGGC